MTPQRRLPLLHHSSKPELKKLPRLLHDFPNFLLDCDENESALCADLKAHPSQMALRGTATAAQDSHAETGGNAAEKMPTLFEPGASVKT